MRSRVMWDVSGLTPDTPIAIWVELPVEEAVVERLSLLAEVAWLFDLDALFLRSIRLMNPIITGAFGARSNGLPNRSGLHTGCSWRYTFCCDF